MNETSGRLRPAVMAYLNGQELSAEQIAALRAYFRQWIMADGFQGPLIDVLRDTVGGLSTRADIRAWLRIAERACADPL
jgi:hypothetical protein